MKQIQYYGNKNIIASRVKERRNQLDLSQEQLAARMQTMNCNIDQQMISKIVLEIYDNQILKIFTSKLP